MLFNLNDDNFITKHRTLLQMTNRWTVECVLCRGTVDRAKGSSFTLWPVLHKNTAMKKS